MTKMWLLKNPYALRLHFRLYAEREHAPLMFLLGECIHGSCVELNKYRVSYKVIVHDASTDRYLRYDVWVGYTTSAPGGHSSVYAISAFCYTYSHDVGCWLQRIDDEDYKAFESVHAQIRDQLQHNFRTIDSGWTENDQDALECPWLFSKMVAFHQECTPNTRKRIRRFVDRLLLSRRWRLRAREIMTNIAFSKWKEWYYDPNNKEGYVKRLVQLKKQHSRTDRSHCLKL